MSDNTKQTPSIFTDDQLSFLKAPLAKEHVKQREGMGKTLLNYLPGYHVIGEANKIFGFGKWETSIVALEMVDRTEYEKPPYKAGDKSKQMISYSYTCQLKLTVTGENGSAHHTDIGFGSGIAGNTATGKASAIELATKEAVTDALKRCLRYYGDQFGLSLYDTTDQFIPSLESIESAKPVTPEQLSELRALYADRDITDEWVVAALKGENWEGESLDTLRQDWYRHALSLVLDYKREELERASFAHESRHTIEMMKKSVNINMLKGLFKGVWTKAKSLDDKEVMREAQEVYEDMKDILEGGEKK